MRNAPAVFNFWVANPVEIRSIPARRLNTSWLSPFLPLYASADLPKPSLSPRIDQEAKCAWHRPGTRVRLLFGRLWCFLKIDRICENVLRFGIVRHRLRPNSVFTFPAFTTDRASPRETYVPIPHVWTQR